MSKYLIFISLWVLIVAQLSAQSACWKIAQEYSCSEYVFDIKFTDTQHGWVLGNHGYILHTSDGGSSWSQQTSNITSAIVRGYFFNNSLGFTSGANYICKTTDGGQTWTPSWMGNVWLLDIFFTNTSTGWAAGRTYGGNGIVLKTIDGGATWQSISFPSTMPALGGVFFINSNTGWIVGSGGKIYKTTDGGSNWLLQSSPTTNQLNNVFFLNPQLGWISAGTIVLKTQNGGTTWDSISPILNEQYWTTLANQPIRFFDANNGVCMDHITNDGGLTWHRPCGDFSYANSANNTTWAVSHFTSLNNGWVKSQEYGTKISNLINSPQIPPTPNIFFPKSNAYDIQSDTRIAWEADIQCSVDSFHISVGTSPGGQDVVAKFSIPSNHQSRRLVVLGFPCQGNYSYHVPIRNLPDGTKLYVSVSASNSIGESSPNIVAFTTIDYQEDCNLQEDIRWDTLISGIDTMLRVTTPRLPVSNSGIIYNQSFESGFAFDTSHYIKTDDRFGRKERALKMSVGGWTYLPYQHNPVDFTVSLWMQDAYNIGNGNSSLTSSCWSQTFAYPPLFNPLQFHLRNHYISKTCEGYPSGSPIEIEYGAYPPFNWNHFVLTFKDSTATAYMNGVIANQKTLEDKTKGLLNGNFYKNVNWLWSGGSSDGIIYDDFLLFHRALDSSEVRQLYEFKPPMLTIDTAICTDQTIEIAGQSFDTTGCYQTILPYEHPRGCDSTIVLNLVVHPVPTSDITPQGSLTFCQGGSVMFAGPSGSGLSYQWKRNGTNVGTGQTYSANQSGAYTLEVTQNATGCKSVAPAINVTVHPLPTVEAGSNQAICSGSPATLTATSGTPGSFQWNSGVTQGQPFVPTQTQSYTVTVTDGNGCRATDNVTVTVSALPPSTVTPQGPLTFCQGRSVTLAGPGGSGLSYQWKRNGANVGTGQAYSANQSGAYTLEVTQNATGCKSVAPVINVTVHPPPVVSIQTSEPEYCEGDNATLTASGGIQYVWILPTGAQLPLGSQPLVVPQLALPEDQGLYTVIGQDANGCQDTVSVNLTLYPAPSLAITGRDTLCFEENTVLNAVSSGISYQWNTGATSPTLHVYPSAPGAYTYVVTVTDANGCRATRSTTIRVHPRPAVTIGGDQVICNGTAAMLQAGGVGANTFLWSTGAQTAAISVSPNVSTTYHLTGTNQFGCRDTATAVVSVRYPPVSVAGNDQTVCRDTAVFEAALPDGGAGEWIALNTAFIAQPQLATATVFDLESGQNIFRWRVVTPPCPGEALDSVVIFLADQVPSAMPDDTVSLVGQRVEMLLAANDTLNHLTGFVFFLTDADQSGSWSLDSDGKLAFVPNSGFTGIAKATYKVCNALCTDYCDTSSITIIVRKPEDEVGQTQLVTPNGDGHNEDLVFDYLDQYPDNSIVIFNRWGDVVFRAKPYLNNWVRNHSGGKLPAGTYYYILNVQGSLGLIWGNVLLMR